MPDDLTGLLTDDEFHDRYPGVVAKSVSGPHVKSALTRSRYIWFDHPADLYREEPR